jgi:hypothetical protein
LGYTSRNAAPAGDRAAFGKGTNGAGYFAILYVRSPAAFFEDSRFRR